MTQPTAASSLQNKASQSEVEERHTIDQPTFVQFGGIELHAAKRLKRSAAKAMMGFMNSGYRIITGGDQ